MLTEHCRCSLSSSRLLVLLSNSTLLSLLAQIDAAENGNRVTALRVQVPNFDFREEGAYSDNIGFLVLPFGNPFDTERVCTKDDFVMHIQVALLMLIDVNLEVAMVALGCGRHND